MSKVMVFVSNSYKPDPRVKKEISSLKKAGHEIMLVARNSQPKSKVNEKLDDCKIHRITLPIPRKVNYLNGSVYYLRYVWRSYKYAKRKKFDIIHCHDLYTLPIGVLLKGKRKKPLIYDAHEFYPGLHFPKGGLMHKAMDIVERILLKSTDSVITVSQKLAERYESYNPIVLMNCPEKMNLPDIDKTQIRKEFNIPEDAFVLVYQGILSENRNLPMITGELAKKLGQEIPASMILVCGSGPLEYGLKKNAVDNVIFTGHLQQSQLMPLLGASDIGLLLFEKTPNNILGLPNKLFEYMMAGLPSIVSDLPVMKRIVTNENVGMVVNTDIIDEIINAIKVLANSPNKSEEMALNGKKAVEEKYNWDSQARVLVDLYKKLA